MSKRKTVSSKTKNTKLSGTAQPILLSRDENSQLTFSRSSVKTSPKLNINTWHRRIALTATLFLSLTAITGILWAYSSHLYLKDGYLKKKNKAEEIPLSDAEVSVQDALKTARGFFKTDKGIQAVILRSDAGRLFYEVQRKEKRDVFSVLIDAVSGNVVTPVPEKLAVELARQYVAGSPAVKKAEAFTDYQHRNGKKFASVYVVAFAVPGNPEILIDRNSGTILDELDGSRAFHYWITKLHQLQFFGTKKELTIIPGLALIFLIITGVIIWVKRFRAVA
jgi:uncharacterized iron-regulated membrane protein